MSDGKEVDSELLTREKSCRPNEPSDIYFVIPTTNPTLVNKQRLLEETNISKHVHRIEPLVQYNESDRTNCLYRAEPLLRFIVMIMSTSTLL